MSCAIRTQATGSNRNTHTTRALKFVAQVIRGLTLIGPCIANIYAEYNQQDATFHNLSDRYCYLLLAGQASSR